MFYIFCCSLNNFHVFHIAFLSLQAKKEMCEVKQQRLWLAQDEYKHLNNVLSGLAVSRTSCELLNY